MLKHVISLSLRPDLKQHTPERKEVILKTYNSEVKFTCNKELMKDYDLKVSYCSSA